MATSVSGQQDSVRSEMFWRSKDFGRKCDEINRTVGSRGVGYEKLLERVFQHLIIDPSFHKYQYVSGNLKTIYLKMPADIKSRESVVENVDKVESVFCSCFNQLRKNMLKETSVFQLDKFAKISSSISGQLPDNIGPKLKKEIKKCDDFFINKRPILSFVANYSEAVASQGPASLRRIKPILSIDGGGIRGIIPAMILMEIERITKKPIAELFTLIGGTSTGGILALGLTQPHADGSGKPQNSAEDLLRLYTHDHGEIFRPNALYNPQHKGATLEDKLKNHRYTVPDFFDRKFGALTLGHTLTGVVITANSFLDIASKVTALGLSGVWNVGSFLYSAASGSSLSMSSHHSFHKNILLFTKDGLKTCSYAYKRHSFDFGLLERQAGRYDPEEDFEQCSFSDELRVVQQRVGPGNQQTYRMSNIAKITSAAPTFFPPVQHDDQLLFDGGILQNNPAIPCVIDALDKGWKKDDLFMVSIGTGVEATGEDTPIPPRSASDSVADLLMSFWFETTQPQEEEDSALRAMLQRGACHRLQPRFEDKAPQLDDTKPETIALLQKTAREWIDDNLDYLKEICKVLAPGCIQE